jgi:hypothetical protein
MSQDQDLDPVAEQRLKALLRGAVSERDNEEPVPDVLLGVQEKLRIRSGGKFYDDAWSTARNAPVSRYLITSIIMLVILGLSYFVLRPLSGRPEPVRNQPADVQVIAPLPRGAK